MKWKYAYIDQCERNKRMEYSRAYHNSKIAVQTLRHWEYYIQKRRESRKLKGDIEIYLFPKSHLIVGGK